MVITVQRVPKTKKITVSIQSSSLPGMRKISDRAECFSSDHSWETMYNQVWELRSGYLDGLRRSEQNNRPLLALQYATDCPSGQNEIADCIRFKDYKVVCVGPSFWFNQSHALVKFVHAPIFEGSEPWLRAVLFLFNQVFNCGGRHGGENKLSLLAFQVFSGRAG